MSQTSIEKSHSKISSNCQSLYKPSATSRKRVRSDCLVRFKTMFTKVPYCLLVNRIDNLSCHEPCAIPSPFKGYHYGLFPLDTSTPFPWTLATLNGTVHFNNMFQSINTIPVFHCGLDFSEHIAGSWPGYSDLLSQTQGGNTTLISSNQINSPEPLCQRQIRRVEQSTCGQRDVVFTFRTLMHFSCGYIAGFFTSATRTMKTFWPSDTKKCLCTCRFCSIFFLPVKQGHFRHFHSIFALFSTTI